MSEFDPRWELDPNQYHLTVSDVTVQAFSPDTNTLNNSMAIQWPRLLECNPALVDALDDLIDGWHLEDETIDYFEDGFTRGHALLAYEADVLDITLPTVSPETIQNFLAALRIDWQNGADYCQDRLIGFNDKNGKYLDALAGGIPNASLLPVHQAGAFLLGGLNAHDLLWQQMFVDSAIESYKKSVHETSMPTG